MSLTASINAAGPGRSLAETLALIGHQCSFDLRSFRRNRQARFFTVILPVLFLVIFVGVFGWGTVRLASGTIVKDVDVLCARAHGDGYHLRLLRQPGRVDRDAARERHPQATARGPDPGLVLILGRALVAVVTALFMCVLLLAIGSVFYGVSLPTHTVPAVAAAAVLGALTFCSVAYAVASFIGPVDSAQPLVQATLLPLYFISGVFVPQSQISPWLGNIASFFPIRHLSGALVAAYDPGTTGSGVHGTDLAVLAAWAIGGLVVALARFSWMPRGR